MTNKSLGVTYTLKFTDKESKEVNEFLEVNKFEDSPEGIKKLLLHLMRGEIKTEGEADPLVDFVVEHPKEIIDVGNAIVKKIRKKIGF